ncbi:MAG: paraquat-inducible protein A [Motiliproteus sp.]
MTETAATNAPLTACHHCDLLMHRPSLPDGASASCPRCGSTLAKSVSATPQKHLALAMTGLIMLLPAYFLPMLTVEILGRSNSASLVDSVTVTWQNGYPLVALSIALFCLIFPALLLQLLLLLQIKQLPIALQRLMLKSLHVLKEWSMLDIYLLGLLVSIVKIQSMAGLALGSGLLCYVIMMIALFVGLNNFSAEQHWQQLEPSA